MILTCPQCDTRYQADGSKFPAAGRNVRCAKCSHVWHQLGPEPEPDPDAEIFAEEAVASAVAPGDAAAVHTPDAVMGAPQPRVVALTPEPALGGSPSRPSAATAAETASRPVVRAALAGRVTVIAGWAGLLVLVLLIVWAAIRFRDSIATWVPQTASLYGAVGLPVRPHSMDLTDVAYQNQTENGQQVLAVSGKIVNRSSLELTVPQVRISLYDADGRELYHWSFAPGAATLKPGVSAKFSTRLASPPAGTHKLEVRFVKPGE